MTRKEPRSKTGVRIVAGVARVLAAVVIAVAASAALADLSVRPIEFSRILPVVLTGEGIIYILVLGGGAVTAPILLLSVVAAFVLRAGSALAAGALSPQLGGDLLASSKFYYASYWPAAIVQVLMMAVGLRLIRPLISTRRGRPRRSRPQVSEALHDSRREEQRHDVLLAALAEAPAEPPVSPTVLEERQIGDLTAAAEPEPENEEVAEAPALPFEEAPEEAEAEAEGALPPGVIDATPEAATTASEVTAPGAEEEPEKPADAASDEVEPAEAEAAEAEGSVFAESAGPGEDTARLAPVKPISALERAETEPPENLQGMIDVIRDAAGDGTDVRVWRTPDGRTVLAAVPSGTPAVGTGGHADALVNAHLEICAWLGAEPTSQQIVATSVGAWALQALDPGAGVMLIMAARGDTSAGRIQLAGERAARAVRGLAEAALAESVDREPADTDTGLPLIPEQALGEALTAAAAELGGRFPGGWQAWRGPHRRLIAVHATPGADVESAGRKMARMVAPVECFAEAVALDGPDWLTIPAGKTLLTIYWTERADEPMVVCATASDTASFGRVHWELAEIIRLIEVQ